MGTGKLLIVEPLAVSAIQSPHNNGLAGNILTPDPKEIWLSGVAGDTYFDVDMGAAVNVDSFFVGFTNAGGQSVAIQTITGLGGAGTATPVPSSPVRSADTIGARAHAFRRLDAPMAGRFWRFYFFSAASFQVGALVIGRAFEATWDREFGGGRRPIDTSKVTPLAGGGFGVQEGTRKASYSWTFGDLTDTETEQLWAVVQRRGAGKPVLVVERDGGGVAVNEQLHYGLLRDLRAFERRAPAETKWAFDLEQWV